jgi:rhodanese-related sulfurtransferase
MFNKILFILVLFVSSLVADFKGVDAKTLLQMQKNGVVVIDIRTLAEWKDRGIIKGAKTLEFFNSQGEYNLKSWMASFEKLVTTKDTPFIIYCAHANRSKTVGKFLSNQLHYKKSYELAGGIEYGWIDKGYKTVPYK